MNSQKVKNYNYLVVGAFNFSETKKPLALPPGGAEVDRLHYYLRISPQGFFQNSKKFEEMT